MEEKVNESGKVDNRRKFESPDKKQTFYVVTPIAEDIRGADWNYSKTYTKCLVEGITTAAEMMDILMRRGIVGPEFEQRQRELNNELAKKVIELQDSENIDEKQLSAMEVANLREELFNWNQRLNGPMSNTCEQIADDARLEYITSKIIEHENGTKVWETYEDFLKEKNQALAIRARFEVMLYLQGLESDFLEQTPEAVALREIESEIRQKALASLAELDKEVEKIDEPKEDAEKLEKPKSSRKKKSPK